MKLRQAKKIMKNVRMYSKMYWVYGSGRVSKANKICIGHYARVDKNIRAWNMLCESNSLAAVKILQSNN